VHSFRETALVQLASGARRGSCAPRFESWWPQLFLMDAPFCMALFKPAWRVFGARFTAAVRSFRPGKHFLMVLARILALFRSFDRENNFAMAPLPPTLQIHRGYLNRVVSLPTLASLCFAFSGDTSLIFFPWRRFTAQWLMATLPLTSTLD